MKNILFLLFITITISGCGTINSSPTQKSESHSVFIFKVNPDKKIVFFFKGKEEDGIFKQNVFSKAAFHGKPKNGYVVFKAKAGETIALTQYAHKSIGFKNSAWPCQDFKTISFTVPANEVLYMTDITLGEKGEIFNLRLNQNFDRAKTHIQRYYPRLAPDLKQGAFKMIPGERDCDENADYPVAADNSNSEALPIAVDNSTADVLPKAEDKPTLQRHAKTVQNYVAAINAQDIDALLAMLTDDVQRLVIDGETITKKTNNKGELRKFMVAYFDACSTCRVRLANALSTDSKVSALEVASYQTRDGLVEERNVTIYEFSGSLIKRIYYFPAEK